MRESEPAPQPLATNRALRSATLYSSVSLAAPASALRATGGYLFSAHPFATVARRITHRSE